VWDPNSAPGQPEAAKAAAKHAEDRRSGTGGSQTRGIRSGVQEPWQFLASGGKSRHRNNFGSYPWDKRRAKHTETLSTIGLAVAHPQCAQMQSYPAMS